MKDAGSLSLVDLARAINDVVATARDGKTQPAEMSGGSFTITNIGVFGMDGGTPILNPGEAGILCVGQIARRPWVVGTGADERIEPRWVTTLALSFDHRLADGAQGSTFLANVAGILGDPGLALLVLNGLQPSLSPILRPLQADLRRSKGNECEMTLAPQSLDQPYPEPVRRGMVLIIVAGAVVLGLVITVAVLVGVVLPRLRTRIRSGARLRPRRAHAGGERRGCRSPAGRHRTRRPGADLRRRAGPRGRAGDLVPRWHPDRLEVRRAHRAVRRHPRGRGA